MNHLHQAIQRCPRVAVYGTLKHGHRNHHWLNGADMLGQDRLTGITLYDLGPYPALSSRHPQALRWRCMPLTLNS